MNKNRVRVTNQSCPINSPHPIVTSYCPLAYKNTTREHNNRFCYATHQNGETAQNGQGEAVGRWQGVGYVLPCGSLVSLLGPLLGMFV